MLKTFVAFVCERFSLAIVAVGAVFMLLVFLSVEMNASRVGSFPLSFRGNTNVVDVEGPAGPIVSGDRIDLASLTPQQRFWFFAAPADARLTVTVERDGRRFPATISAALPAYSRPAELARDVGMPICFFLTLGLASALFAMRPRAATLAFYLYAILLLVKVYQTPLQLAAWPIGLGVALALQIVYPLAQLALLAFAHRLYGRSGRAWYAIVACAVAAAVVTFVVWENPIVWLVTQRFGIPGPATQLLMPLADAVLLVIVLFGLAYVASGAEGLERRRVAWIVAGIALSPLLDLTWALAGIALVLAGGDAPLLLAVQNWSDALQTWLGALGIVAVVYGFLSQRVVDFRVAISRAAIYAAMTLVLVVFFGVVEWMAEQLFESTKPAMFASLIVALAVGLAIRPMHQRLEALVDGIVFRAQHRAEAALQLAARSLANATSERTVIELLLDEPVARLELASAALFLQADDGSPFVLAAGRGWQPSLAETLDPQSALVVMLRTEMGPLRMDRRLSEEAGLPARERGGGLAFPLVMRGRVFGIVFYGARNDGLPVGDEERALLHAVATNAAAAYDHIDADRARARIAQLEARLREFQPADALGQVRVDDRERIEARDLG